MSLPPASSSVATRAGTTLLRLEGRDALAVLHRISTAALEDLAPGEARATLFCDFRGRLLHRAAVARAGDGAVWLARADAPAGELRAFVERHVFREDLRVSDAPPDRHVAIHYAPAADAGRAEFADGVPRRIALASGETLTISAAAPPIDDRARILAGRPRHGFEIRDAFTPYEVGLASEVHLAKGCYTGQETLLRLVTYESVRRRLVRLAGAGAPPAPGADVLAGGEVAGLVTSAAPAAEPGRFHALAVVRNELAAPGATLALPDLASAIEVHELPAARPAGLP